MYLVQQYCHQRKRVHKLGGQEKFRVAVGYCLRPFSDTLASKFIVNDGSPLSQGIVLEHQSTIPRQDERGDAGLKTKGKVTRPVDLLLASTVFCRWLPSRIRDRCLQRRPFCKEAARSLCERVIIIGYLAPNELSLINRSIHLCSPCVKIV